MRSRFKNAFNAFFNKDPTTYYPNIGFGSTYRPDKTRLSYGNERSMVTAIYNRLALDAASVVMHHVLLDDNGSFLSNVDSGLDWCLNIQANIDQSGTAFIQDIVMSMFDEGCVAVVAVDTEENIDRPNEMDIKSLRTGKIQRWYPQSVEVNVYNELTGVRENITVSKSSVAIIENPLYAVMNETNSTLQRLIRKLILLDAVDEQSSSGKLDLIIQLPYDIKTDYRKGQAEQRRQDIETQLTGSKYGIAYTDGTEHITQLNRPITNNLMGQIEFLTSMLYSQLGITNSVLDGTADEKTMLNYYTRTTEVIVSAIVDGMKRAFLNREQIMKKQSILYFRDPFKFVTLTDLADIGDKLTRNEILSSNEMRQAMGKKPSDDPKANELKNKNISSAD